MEQHEIFSERLRVHLGKNFDAQNQEAAYEHYLAELRLRHLMRVRILAMEAIADRRAIAITKDSKPPDHLVSKIQYDLELFWSAPRGPEGATGMRPMLTEVDDQLERIRAAQGEARLALAHIFVERFNRQDTAIRSELIEKGTFMEGASVGVERYVRVDETTASLIAGR